MKKRKKQAIIWIFVWLFLTILPFLTIFYFGFFVIILSPFAGFILIKLIRDVIRGEYDN